MFVICLISYQALHFFVELAVLFFDIVFALDIINGMKINIDKFKKKLEEELENLTAELTKIGRINPNNPADWEALPTEADTPREEANEFADRIEDYEENTAILKELEIRFNEVKNALERIKKETYGVCCVCGEQIEIKRLEANEAATTCVKHMK